MRIFTAFPVKNRLEINLNLFARAQLVNKSAVSWDIFIKLEFIVLKNEVLFLMNNGSDPLTINCEYYENSLISNS